MEAHGHHIKMGLRCRHKGQQLFPLSLSPISTIQVMGGSLEKKGPIIIDNQSSTQKLTLSQRATVVCQAVEKFNPDSWKYFWVFYSIFLSIVFKSLICCFSIMPCISCRSQRNPCQHLVKTDIFCFVSLSNSFVKGQIVDWLQEKVPPLLLWAINYS